MVIDTEAGWSCQFVKIVVNSDGLIDHFNIPMGFVLFYEMITRLALSKL